MLFHMRTTPSCAAAPQVMRVYGTAVHSGGPTATGSPAAGPTGGAGEGEGGGGGGGVAGEQQLGITGHAQHHERGATGVPWLMGSLGSSPPAAAGLPLSTK